ncbi:MAG TPA: peptidase dimerization domain-containing protein, partial [Negativicutes bacterium]|nr:peptidase dimerization domain-containing protein [Negativicutes bacterium]
YHSKMAAVIPSAAWRLVWALSTLKDANENILIDGFYSQVRDTLKEEYDLLLPFAAEAEKVRTRANIKEFVKQAEGIEYAKQLFNAPTCNISGISSGYTGNGSKTVLPCYAMAKLDFRLVVDQDPAEIVNLLRTHLDKHGFEDVEIHTLSGCKPSKTSPNTPFLDVVLESGKQVYDKPFIVGPTMPGTGPRELFSQWTDMPIVALGPGYPGSKNHAPNENLVLTDYFEAVKHIIALLYKYAEK